MLVNYTKAVFCTAYVTAFLPIYVTGARAQIFEQSQVIDQYLNPTIYGTDIQPGVTVTSRLHPDYDPAGIHIGQFTIKANLLESVGYDDNVTGMQKGHGSAAIDTTSNVTATNTMTDGSISAQGSVADFEYPSISQQSYTTWTAGLTGTHKFGDDLLLVTATHYTQEETARELTVPQLDSPIAYQIDDFQAAYSFSLGRLQLQPGIEFTYYIFDNGTVAGEPYLQSYRDRVVYYPSFTARYEFATRRDLLLVIRDATASYLNSVAGLPTQNFNDISMMSGISYDIDGIINFRLLAGYEQRNFSSRVYKKIQAPILEGAIVWTPTELTTIAATAARYITDTAAEGTVGETQTTLKISVDHEVLRNVILNVKAGFGSAAYTGDRSQDIYEIGFGATWKLNRRLRLGIDYRFTDRPSGNIATQQISQPSIYAAAQSYKENVIRFQIGVGF